MARKKDGEYLFDTHVKPRFDEIKEWARAGATHKEIAAALNIGYSTFTLYVKNESELRELMLNAQMSGVPTVKMALWKRATGYDYEEKKISMRKDEETGELKKFTEITTKHCPPDVSAIAMYLRNNGDNWRDKDAKTYEFKEEELKLRKMLAESQEWK